MAIKVLAIVAMDQARGIGSENAIPWHLPEDLKRFSALTTGHTVLMGRKTYQSLPDKYRPLPNRKNVVLTRDASSLAGEEGIEISDSPAQFVQRCRSGEVELPSDQLWVIGGEQIYKLLLPLCDELHLTRVDGSHKADAHFPEFESEFELIEEDAHEGYSFLTFRRLAQ